MPKRIMPLTDLQVKNAKPTEKNYKLSDGGGLYLLITPTGGKLWRYNLHYFDYLHEEGRSWENKVFLLGDWIQKNPQGTPDAWEPFPVSLRIVNWIKFFLSPEAVGRVDERWLQSLYLQALWLRKNIEYHLLANHLFKNGKALIFAGLFFSGADADRWLKKGLAIISQEIEEQILADGGHFERSPMYHAMILEDCLDLFNIMDGQDIAWVQSLRRRLRLKAAGMVGFLDGMTHPDGDIALFNDAAIGIEARPAELANYFERLTGEKALGLNGEYGSFSATGYHIMAPRPGDRLIIDCGPVGPDYQPGHAHCDTLSFELSLKGRRVVVDSGCAQYLDGPIRRYNRENIGHNTVTVDGENQSEVWGAHRCARRARPVGGGLVKLADDSFRFEGGHDGYCRLSGRPVHRRTVTWQGNTILVADQIDGTGQHVMGSRLHIHPALRVSLQDNRAVLQAEDETVAVVELVGDGRMETLPGWYCPEFGLQMECVVLASTTSLTSLPWHGGWKIITG